ncbi:f-box domain-containing protein [Fusarium pseudoanthophilum]|uniref:F-box domain-containing protein n=1 Tax=Fusarium pseudoanthophilum TaxID=48495 RepID=A0A8H5P726_9HYPO|nr:f-box domain-containing protein [Fusarium pseudoanthophilum]
MAQCLYRCPNLFQPAPAQATRNTAALETKAVTLSWDRLPAEIRRCILDLLSHEPLRKHVYATVCREWRIFMEEKIFRKLTVCQHGLVGLAQLSAQPRSAIKHLWLNMEINGPPCPYFLPAFLPASSLSFPIPNAEYHLHHLFSILSSWGYSERGLTLEFNAYCPLEQAHWIKNWFIGCPGESHRIPVLTVDPGHDWRNATLDSRLRIIDACYEPVSFTNLMTLPLADAVTKFVIRRHCRNRYRPSDIARLVNACPRLVHLHLETWRHSYAPDITSQNPTTGLPQYDLIANIHPRTLRTLTVYESYHAYTLIAPQVYGHRRVYVDHSRWFSENSKQFAARSLGLQQLSISFMATAEAFFSHCQPDWTWKGLKTIFLTTNQFTEDPESRAVSVFLQNAAQVALRMPSLETMVLWRAWPPHTGSFTYRRRDGTIIWCSTTDLDFDRATLEAWGEVAKQHQHLYLRSEKRLIERRQVISDGDAIRLLELPPLVIDPESREQIEKEHEIFNGRN